MNSGRYLSRLVFGLLLILVSQNHSLAQQNSVLADGTWVKMEFDQHGVYKIDRATLSQMGFDINSLDPRNLQIYGRPGGMVPQPNAENPSLLLQELHIYVQGEADGQMGPDDFILFYVDRVDQLRYNGQTYDMVKNLYSEQVYYFLTLGNSPGQRVASLPQLQTADAPITNYDRVISHEEDQVNILGSGREWYGERLDTETPLTLSFDAGNLATNQDIIVSFTGMAQSLQSSSMELALNNLTLGEVNFNAIPDAPYGIKGNERSRQIKISSSDLSIGSTLDLTVQYNKNGVSNAVGFINNFTILVPTPLSYTGSAFNFRAQASLDRSIAAFSISNSPANLSVWDVTDPIAPRAQETELTGSTSSFGTLSSTLREYVAFTPDNVAAVENFETLANQNLSGQAIPDLLILTNETLLPQATRLANFREQYDGLTVRVVTVQEVYNEFSAGRQDISAIRNFARYLKEQDDKFKYLLFFGKGSYDYKDRVENNANVVPTYEARNSLHPLLSYSSDDYFGFLDEDEGLWAESGLGDHLLDIGIGRIPATTVEQAATAVDKIIAYQTDPQSLGDWRSRLVFIADDGDRNIHQRDADSLATLVDTTYAAYNVSKLYLDAFEQETRPNGEFSPDAVNALLDAVDRGALIINFTGHGAETGWMQERILTTDLIDEWDNTSKLPLLVTATCEFGRNDDPSIFSGAEKMIFKPDGGALALVTTARPVFSSTNYNLNRALYSSILDSESGEYPRLGDIIQFTKNNSLSGSLNRNFILLGDPSMRLAYPENQIAIRTINTSPVNIQEPDTIRALQTVRITGVIESNSQTIQSFNGTLDFTLFDKSNRLQTKGTESEVFEYLERNSTLFSGSVTVTDGLFEVEFVVPKNINYQFGSGKMTFYATNDQGSSDALGASIDFIIGGTDEEVLADNDAPLIRPFLNDTSAVSNYVVKQDVDLLLLLEDESGINISKSGIGQDITATLNDSVTFVLNDFYTTETDNFRKGIVRFPIRNLPIGTNTLNIRAWDTHNNASNAQLEFTVTDENSTTITEINAYPNPFNNIMTFAVSHNSAGQSIELVVEIFNQKGEKVRAIYQTNQEADNVESVTWNGTDNTGHSLPVGIYIYNVLLRSENSEIVHSSRHKLIISN